MHDVITLNDEMPQHAAQRIIHAVGGNTQARIAVLGLSFNAGSDDVRDTPSAKIIRELNASGYKNLIAWDPFAVKAFAELYSDVVCKYACSCDEALDGAEVAAVLTAWPEFRYLKNTTDKILIDCRYML